jgi:tRNA-Thr(GGU) m(6)t(6)A37 methyltransferase TsaA
LQTIGMIYTPFDDIENMPVQPKGAKDVEGRISIHESYAEGLKDIEGFSHIYLIYPFHKAARTELIVTPFLDTVERGVFATRSPLRPNHIGLSIVRLIKREGTELIVKDVDILNETPLWDIKPYIEKFDAVADSTSGWLKATVEDISNKRSDKRFK